MTLVSPGHTADDGYVRNAAMTIPRIVVGTDGSAPAATAVRWAAEEALGRGAALEVVHAWLPPSPVLPTDLYADDTPLQRAAEALVNATVARVRQEVPDLIEVWASAQMEHPAPALLCAAVGAELLVVGSRGGGGLAALVLWPVRYVNDPRVIAQEEGFVSINSTISVDLMGQCASETVHGEYYSSSGGQADFARGAMYSKGGQGFVVLRSTAKGGTVSKIVAELEPGDVVTTLKNTVDKVVTEWGVAELRGRSLRERAAALIGIAHPDHRDRLTHDARRLGHL